MMSVFAYFGIMMFISIIYVFISERIKLRKSKKLAKKLNIDTSNWKTEHFIQFYNAQKVAKKLGDKVEQVKTEKSNVDLVEKPNNIVTDDKN